MKKSSALSILAVLAFAVGCGAERTRQPTSETATPALATTISAQVQPASLAWSEREILPAGGVLHAVSCSDGTSCVAVGLRQVGEGSIFYSRDGGANWALASTPPSLRDVFDVACEGDGVCVASAGIMTTGVAILQSTDRGVTWSQTGEIQSPDLVYVACVARMCLAASSRQPIDLRASIDGGQTWHRASPPREKAGSELSGIWCSAPHACWLGLGVDRPRSLFVTTDNGTTWADRTPPDDLAYFANDLSCTEDGGCELAGDGRAPIWQTTDDGRRWSTAGVPSALFSDVTQISCDIPGQCVAFARDPASRKIVVLRRSGNPPGWTAEQFPPGLAINSMTCTANGHCIAVSGGTVLTANVVE